MPIFDHEAGHPAELGSVVRHSRAAVRQGDGRDLHVIRADDLPQRFQMNAKRGKLVGRRVIEWQTDHRSEQGINIIGLAWPHKLPYFCESPVTEIEEMQDLMKTWHPWEEKGEPFPIW